jgi:hypothetical protein
MRTLIAALRAAYGTVLLAIPGPVLEAFGAPPDQPAETVARVLGARHVAQAVATRRGRFARVGAAVDALHAASMFAFAAVDDVHRRAALVDGTIAAALCAGGLAAPAAE